MRVFCSYIHSMNRMYAYLRNDRKIKFRTVSAQHFINEAPGVIRLCSICAVEINIFPLLRNNTNNSGQ